MTENTLYDIHCYHCGTLICKASHQSVSLCWRCNIELNGAEVKDGKYSIRRYHED